MDTISRRLEKNRGSREAMLDGLNLSKFGKELGNEIEKVDPIILSINQCKLRSFEAFNVLPNVELLEATDNSLGDNQIKEICHIFPNLKTLEIGGNKIKELNSLSNLKSLTKLERLGIELNPFAIDGGYINEIFNTLPQLSIVDNIDKNGNEVEKEEEIDTTLKEFYERDYDDIECLDDEEYSVSESEESGMDSEMEDLEHLDAENE